MTSTHADATTKTDSTTKEDAKSIVYGWMAAWDLLDELETQLPWKHHFPGSPSVMNVVQYVRSVFDAKSAENKLVIAKLERLNAQVEFNLRFECEHFETLR